MEGRIGRIVLGAFGVALAAAPVAATGQTTLTLSGGPAEYDLAGTGWSGVAAVHAERPVRSWLRLEAGSGLFWYDEQFGADIVMLLPEVGVAFQAPDAFPVFLGLGAGHTLVVRSSAPDDPTLYGAAGFRIPVGDGWSVRPEMRLRFIDPFHGVIAGYVLGVGRRLGG